MKSHEGISILIVVFLLMLLNWGIEAQKWRVLLHRFYQIGFIKAFAATLAGNSISIWVPNRAGEYFGRLFFVTPNFRIKSILATLIGGIAQLLVTLITGGLGLMFYVYHRTGNQYFLAGTICGSLICWVVLLVLYFNLNHIAAIIPENHYGKKLRRLLSVYKEFHFKDMLKVLSYSFSRYLVFSSQFVMLLYFFGVEIKPEIAWLLVTLNYLIITAIPTSALTEIIIRGTTAHFIFSGFTTHIAGVELAAYGLWLINIVLPSIAGIFFLLSAKSKVKA